MAGGFLVGLGRGIESAGDSYAKMKMAAIDRMFREQQMALQQKQFDATLQNNQFDQTRQIFSQLPAGSDVSSLQVPAGGRALADAFTKKSPVVQDVPTTLMVPSGARPPNDAPYAPEPLMPISPTPERAPAEFEMSTATSIPFEDTRARTAMYNQGQANNRHAGTQTTRLRIAEMVNAARMAAIASQDARSKAALGQGWARLEQMGKAYDLRAMEVGADIANMEYDNLLNAYIAENGRPGGAGGDMWQQMMMRGGLPGMPQMPGATPGAAPAPPAAPRPPAPVPPRLQKGGGGQPVDPNDPLGLLK